VFASIAKYGYSNHKTDITIEFASKNRSRTYITLMCLPLLPNMVTPIMTDITIEFASKNRSRTYITLTCLPVLPNMVTLITKQTSPLNLHQKTAPEHI
jgi:hypothetical protein